MEDALIKRRIEINGDWTPNWSCINQPKYFVTMDDETCELNVGVHFEYDMKPTFGYFESREKVKYFIKQYSLLIEWFILEYKPVRDFVGTLLAEGSDDCLLAPNYYL